jgi:hypothetical protein
MNACSLPLTVASRCAQEAGNSPAMAIARGAHPSDHARHQRPDYQPVVTNSFTAHRKGRLSYVILPPRRQKLAYFPRYHYTPFRCVRIWLQAIEWLPSFSLMRRWHGRSSREVNSLREIPVLKRVVERHTLGARRCEDLGECRRGA